MSKRTKFKLCRFGSDLQFRATVFYFEVNMVMRGKHCYVMIVMLLI